jgi:hypothetical protein
MARVRPECRRFSGCQRLTVEESRDSFPSEDLVAVVDLGDFRYFALVPLVFIECRRPGSPFTQRGRRGNFGEFKTGSLGDRNPSVYISARAEVVRIVVQ